MQRDTCLDFYVVYVSIAYSSLYANAKKRGKSFVGLEEHALKFGQKERETGRSQLCLNCVQDLEPQESQEPMGLPHIIFDYST